MVRQGSAKASFVGSIPTLASNKLFVFNDLQIGKERVSVKLLPEYYSITTPSLLANYWKRRDTQPSGVAETPKIACGLIG